MEVTDDNFEEKVVEASKEKLVVVDFWAEWCGPCNMLAPTLDNVVESFGDKVVLVKLNVDQNPEIANKFNVNAIPDVKFFKDGNLVDSFVGVQSEDKIKGLIEKNL